MRILLVDDDRSLSQAVSAVLTKQNYVVDTAADGQDAWELATAFNYDLILLDITLPKLDGISLCRQLRKAGYGTPILLLTAKDTGTDKVMGLDAGADDYVVKPFEFQELTARIRALLRRGVSTLPPILEWASLRLDPSSCEVSYGGQALHLAPKEYAILELFLRNGQRVFSRGAIVDHLWNLADPPQEDTIKSHIKGLRQKLKAAGAPTDLIETVYGLGYRLKPLSSQQNGEIQATQPELTQSQQRTLLAVAEAREDFKARLGDRIAILERATRDLINSRLSTQLRQQAEQEAHKLAGALGSFGFGEGSQLAREIEDLLQNTTSITQGNACGGSGDSRAQAQTQSLHLLELVIKLYRQLELTPLEPTYIKPVVNEPSQNLLLVVSSDSQLVEGLVEEATKRKMLVEIAKDLDAARVAIATHSPQVVLLDLYPHNAENGLKLLSELSNQSPPVPVLVFTGNLDSLTARLEVVRRGGCGLLHKSMPLNQVFERVTQILQRFRSSKTKVMVVDDDPQMLKVIQSILEPWGIQLTILEDSQRFWNILTKFSPDLLILDVKMPHISGVELCQVVRNDPQWYRLPIMFLTAHINTDTVEQLFAVGADDCVSKPVEGSKLATRIFNCLERSRIYQAAPFLI